MAERKTYRVQITFKSGTMIEADVVNPDIQVQDYKVSDFTWENPEGAIRLAYVDLNEIAGIIVHELGEMYSGTI